MMLPVKFATVFVVHFILVLSVDVWTTGLQTQCTSALWWIMPFLGNYFKSCGVLSSFLEEKGSLEAKILQGLFHSWETNCTLPLSVSPYLCSAHTWSIYIKNMTNKPWIWFQQGKNDILIKRYHIPTEAVKRLPLASIQIELDPQKPLLPFIQSQQTMTRGICRLDAEE